VVLWVFLFLFLFFFSLFLNPAFCIPWPYYFQASNQFLIIFSLLVSVTFIPEFVISDTVT